MGSVRRYLQFIRPYWKEIMLAIGIGLVKFGIPLLLPLLLKYVVDDVLLATHLTLQHKIETLIHLSLWAILIFVILRYPVEYYRMYFAQWTASRVLYDIRNRLFEHAQKLSLKFYHRQKTGQIISRMINDVEQTKEFVVTGLMNIWLDLFTLTFAIGVMLWMDPWMTLIALAVFPLYGISVKYLYKHLRRTTRERSQALAELQAHLHERIQGVSVIKAFHLEDYEQDKFAEKNGHYLDKAFTHARWTAKTHAAINMITDWAPILVIMVSAYQVLHGTMTIGEMTAFYGYLNLIYAPVRRLVNASTTLTQAHASMDRVFEFLDEPYDIVERPNAFALPNGNGDIEFRQVSFRYHDKQEPVLKQMSFTIPSGKTVAFVGSSGGGKSTIMSLISRFYDVSDGRILIGGRDIRDYSLRALREQIGFVLQDNILFSGTIEDNIRLGKIDATMEEIITAAKAANAHEFISQLPQGYQTEIGERGIKLSGGQKQRIALARVFLKKPKILILDEATSALDLESENSIQQSLKQLTKDCTTIIVAHRLSTITHADQIYLIDHGKIVEQGTHEELMKRGGRYAELFRVQHLEATV